jgi:hypothetical protein
MIALDVLYTALATIAIMVVIQVVIFFVARVMTPPQPKVIYRNIMMPPPESQPPPPKVAFTEPPVTEVKLPEYEPRQQASDSLRLDTELPAGITETRPPGT